MTGATLGSLFDERPPRWGLRGDPGLWAELAERFAATPLPDSYAALWQMLEQAYTAAVGQPLTDPRAVSLPRFDHGGLSQGAVSPHTWATQLFPLIHARFAALHHRAAPSYP